MADQLPDGLRLRGRSFSFSNLLQRKDDTPVISKGPVVAKPPQGVDAAAGVDVKDGGGEGDLPLQPESKRRPAVKQNVSDVVLHGQIRISKM